MIYSNSSQTRGLFSAVLLSLSRGDRDIREWPRRRPDKFCVFKNIAIFFMYMYFVGFMNEKQAAHWRSLRLKIHFHFSILGAQTTTMVTEALMAQPKGFICTCALIFIVYFFVCFMQNKVELMFNLKVLWRTQTFSHEIHIKNHSLKYISRLEQTNNLISKLNKLRYWKKYQ